MIVTSNRSVGDWGSIFSDAVVATVILDRILNQSHVILIRGESYRLREKRRAGLRTRRNHGVKVGQISCRHRVRFRCRLTRIEFVKPVEVAVRQLKGDDDVAVAILPQEVPLTNRVVKDCPGVPLGRMCRPNLPSRSRCRRERGHNHTAVSRAGRSGWRLMSGHFASRVAVCLDMRTQHRYRGRSSIQNTEKRYRIFNERYAMPDGARGSDGACGI